MKKNYTLLFFIILLFHNNIKSATYYSRTTGNWTNPATWSTVACGGAVSTTIPTAVDNVIICSGNTVTMDGNTGSCLSLTVNGTANWVNNNRTTNVGVGGLTMNNGSVLTGTATGVLNVTGGLIVPTAALATIGRLTITVTGQTTVSGTLRFNSNTGTKTFGNFVMNSGSTVNSTSGETYNINGNLTITAATISGTATGRFIVSGTFNVLAGSSTVNAGTLRITGLSTITGTFNIGSTAGGKTFGDITIANTGVFNNAANDAVTINGNFQNNGSIAAGTTANYTFAGNNKTISGTSATALPRMNCSGSYINNSVLTITNRLTGNGTFSEGTTGTLNYNGDVTLFTVNTFNASAIGNTVSFGMAANYSIRIPSDGRYYNLTVTGNFTKSLSANTIVGGTVLISAGTTLNSNNRTLAVGGNFTNNNIFTAGTSTVTLNGTSNQTIGGTAITTFNNLTLNNTTGATLAINTAVGATLTFTNGVITTNSNKVTINIGGSVTGAGTGKFVNGYLEKNISTGTNVTRTFEVGNGASHFLPLLTNFASVTTAGRITVRANNGDHANITTSCIDETKSVNRNWELINTGTVFTNYSATCNFIGVPTDADAGSVTANYYMAIYNGSTWTTLTRGAVAATSNQGTGITSVGFLQVGERRAPVITTQPLAVNACGGSSATFNVLATGIGLTYQWQLSTNGGGTYNNVTNGGVYSGALTASLLINPTSVGMNNYRYRCIVTSTCVTSTTSNAGILTVSATAPASVSISASPSNTICFGSNVTFTATPTNGGTTPVYQWKLNGINVGANSATYSNASLANGNVISCVMTSNAGCATGSPATSNSITMIVNPNLPVSVSIVSSQPSSACSGTNITFTATPSNGGAAPFYQWLLNGGSVGTNSATYSNSTLINGDIVSCVLTSNATCTSGNPATSNTITQTVASTGTWLGVTSVNWTDPTNWCGGVPDITSNISIPSGTTFQPIMDAPGDCNNLAIQAGAIIDLNNNALNVYGAISGTGTLKGSSSSVLNFEVGSASGGTFYMDQSTPGITNALSQITINRSGAVVTLGSLLEINNVVSVLDGTFATGNNLTLISNVSGTARVDELVATADITGNVTVQRYVEGGTDGWVFLGAPVSGITMQQWNDDFITGGFPGSQYPTTVTNPSIYGYNETIGGIYDDGFVIPTNITNPISQRKGYWVYLLNTPLTIDVTGPILKKNQNFGVTYTDDPAQPAEEDGWNLLSNPYPSTIDWDAAGWTKNNVADAIYMYNPTADQYTSYIAGIGTNGGSNLIASSQAFLIQTTGASPSLQLDESVKNTTDAPFVRTMNNSINDDFLKLVLVGNNYSDETYIRFDSAAANGFDASLDAVKLFSYNSAVPSMSTIAGTREMSINSLPVLNNSISVPLKVLVGVSGTYSITIDTSSQIPVNTCLVLEDLLTGTQTDLRLNNTYSFSIEDTTTTARFLIHFGGDIVKNFTTPSCSNTNDGSAYAKGVGAGPFNYSWFDPAGQLVQNHLNVIGGDSLLAINGGVYTVQISGNQGSCFSDITTSIDIAEPDALNVSVFSTDASCQSSTDGSLLLEHINGGVEPYTFMWSNGVVSEENTNLPANTYILIVTDSTNCSISNTYTINYSNSIQSNFNMSVDSVYLDNNMPVLFTDNSFGAVSYTWDFGDGSAFDYSANPSHLYSIAGVYSVTLIVSNGTCSDTLVQQINVLNALVTGINEFSENNTIQTVTTGNSVDLIFNYNESTIVSIQVYNSQGQIVFAPQQTTVFKNRLAYNFAGKAMGLYYFRIISGNTTTVKKVVKS